MEMKKKGSKKKFLFGKSNYIFLIISSVIICIGFILMSGGEAMTQIFSMTKFLTSEEFG